MLNQTAPSETRTIVSMEVLQPEISHEIKIVTLDVLKSWIEEGKLLPNHQVRLKNLNWLNACDLQSLKPVFEKFKETAKAKLVAAELAKPVARKPAPENVSSKAEVIAPSIPFRLYEEKLSGKSNDETRKTHESNPPSLKKTKPPAKVKQKTASLAKFGQSVVRSIGIFVGGCALMFALAYGGSYFWIYSIRGTLKIDETKVGELALLEQTIYNEKVALRLKSAESGSGIDINAEFSKLDKRLSESRKPIIESYRQNMLSNDFNNLFYFSLAVLLVSFILSRLIFAKRQQLATQSGRSIENGFESSKDSGSFAYSETDDFEGDIHQTLLNQTQITNSPEIHDTGSNESKSRKSIASGGELDELLVNPEYQQIIEQENIKFCLMHRSTSSDFVCEKCQNHFCDKCVTTVESKENCCQFCQIPCKPSESAKTKIIFVNTGSETNKAATKPKKEINLVVEVESENRSYRIGFVPAFMLSLCFSLSTAYFWVYEISPRLEPKTEEVAQTVSNNSNANIANSAANTNTNSAKKVAYDSQPLTDANTGKPIQRKCIDPESKETFDCDEETYKALYDHTAKTKSVEEAQKSVEEKTKLILSPILPTEEGDEKSKEKTKVLSPEEEEKIANDRTKFYQIFGISFALMFCGLLSTRLIFKDESDSIGELK